jgi:hypothetical protein
LAARRSGAQSMRRGDIVVQREVRKKFLIDMLL